MSVLIMVMEMPKSCAECRFRDSDSESRDPFTEYCYLTNARLGYYDNRRAKWRTERRKDCPLVAVDEKATSPCERCPVMMDDAEKPPLTLWSCDRNICKQNEYMGIDCGECEITKHNKIVMDEVTE